jgi:lysine-ketoglutarate reductase/saccharopine dehydrogenase-like protein (TIGR00300 family)
VRTETVEISGHLMDSGILSRVLDDIREYDGDYVIDRFDVGHDAGDISHAQISVSAENDEALQRLLMRLQTRGVNQVDPGQAEVAVAEQDGVFPDGFYSSTNLETEVRLDGTWIAVDNPEMDCGLIVDDSDGTVRVHTLPMADVRAGMKVVCGASGIKVKAPISTREEGGFGLMESAVSSEKPQAVLVRQIARRRREVKGDGHRILWVAGPAGVHPGAAPARVALVDAGYVDVLFAGNALATHDIESALYGTSLGVDLAQGKGVEHGHEHHIRAINTIRRCGTIAAAVEQGVLTSGIMHALVRKEKQFVLVGSVRDDGPLPFDDVGVDVGQWSVVAHRADEDELLRVPDHCVHDAAGESAVGDRRRDRARAADRVDGTDVVLVPVLDAFAVGEVDAQRGAVQRGLDVVSGEGVAGEEDVDEVVLHQCHHRGRRAGVDDGRPADPQDLAAVGLHLTHALRDLPDEQGLWLLARDCR